jgi:hypothetical protein
MCRPWTSLELRFLRESAHLGRRELARLLGRSEGAVRHAAARYGISLRREGERRGSIIGAGRGHAGALRAAIAADPGRLAAALAAPLCPDCGRRPALVRASGLCEPCHVAYLERLYAAARPDREQAEALFLAIAEQWGGELDTKALLSRARKRRQRARQGL